MDLEKEIKKITSYDKNKKLKYLISLDDVKKSYILNYIFNDLFNNSFNLSVNDLLKIIVSFKNFNFKKVYADMIYQFLDDDAKLKVFPFLSDEKRTIILLDATDDIKMKFLPYILNDNNKIIIIKSVNDDRLIKNNIKFNSIYDKNLFKEIKSKTSISLYDDNLDCDDMTFGIELESILGNAFMIKEYGKSLFGRWTVKDDRSLIKNNVEVNSPIMKYNKDYLKELYAVCKFMKFNGLDVDSSCSSHIHIGTDGLKNNKALEILYGLYCSMENELFLMINEKNTLPRENINIYSKPISDNFFSAIGENNIKLNSFTFDDFVSFIENYVQISYSSKDNKYYTNRNCSLNIMNAHKDGKHTIEFRMPNGSLDPNVLHQNIKLFLRLVYTSNRLSYLNDKEIVKELSFLEYDDEDRVLGFLKLIFNNKEDINYFYDRYITNNELNREDRYAKIRKWIKY